MSRVTFLKNKEVFFCLFFCFFKQKSFPVRSFIYHKYSKKLYSSIWKLTFVSKKALFCGYLLESIQHSKGFLPILSEAVGLGEKYIILYLKSKCTFRVCWGEPLTTHLKQIFPFDFQSKNGNCLF